MTMYIIIARSILDNGMLGKSKEVYPIAFSSIYANSETEALAKYQFECLRGKGSYLTDDHDILHLGGLQFEAITRKELNDLQKEEDEMEGIYSKDELMEMATNPTENRLDRLMEIINPKPLEQMTNDQIIVLGREQEYERWTYSRYLTPDERLARMASKDMNWRP